MPGGAYTDLKTLCALRHSASLATTGRYRTVHSDLSGRKRSHRRGRGLEFDELRHYRPGDDIRAMDWRLTQRLGNPYVRIYKEERDRPVWLLIDQRSSLFFGSRHQMKSVATAELAALHAWHTLAEGDRVGALILGPKSVHYTKPSRSHSRAVYWLGHLVRVNQSLRAGQNSEQTQTLADAMTTLNQQLSRDGLIVIISDFNDWDDHCLQHVRRMRRRNDVIAYRVSDALEENPGQTGDWVMTDGRHQLEVSARHSVALSNYQKLVEQRRNQLRADLAREGVALRAVHTARPIIQQWQRQMAREQAS